MDKSKLNLVKLSVDVKFTDGTRYCLKDGTIESGGYSFPAIPLEAAEFMTRVLRVLGAAEQEWNEHQLGTVKGSTPVMEPEVPAT